MVLKVILELSPVLDYWSNQELIIVNYSCDHTK